MSENMTNGAEVHEDAESKPVLPVLGMGVDMEVTPRWFAAGPNFWEDWLDVVRVVADISKGDPPRQRPGYLFVSGMRFEMDANGQPRVYVTQRMLAPCDTTLYAQDQGIFRNYLDGLDASTPRRRGVTEERLAALGAQARAAAANVTPEPEAAS